MPLEPEWELIPKLRIDPPTKQILEEIPGIHVRMRQRNLVVQGPLNAVPLVDSIHGVLQGQVRWKSMPAAVPEWAEVEAAIRADGGIKPDILASLYPWQKEATAFGLSRLNFHIWHAPGSGKTLTMLLCAAVRPGPAVFIVPAKVRLQWGRAVARFSTWDPYVWTPKSQRRKRDRTPDAYLEAQQAKGRKPIIIAGLESMDEWAPWVLANVSNYHLFIDETHRLKSNRRNQSVPVTAPTNFFELEELKEKAKALGGFLRQDDVMGTLEFSMIVPRENRAKQAETLSKKAVTRVGATGTAVFDRTRDLWGQLDLISPYSFGSFTVFGKRYCDGRTSQYTRFDTSGMSYVEELASRLAMIVHKVDRQQTSAHLPSKRRDVYYIPQEMLGASSPGFGKMLKEAAKSGSATSVLWVKLAELASRKRKVVVSLLEDQVADGKSKCVVFTGTHADCEGLGEAATKGLKGVRVWYAHGGMSPKHRDAVLQAYTACPGPCVLIGTWDAYGESVDGMQCTDLFLAAMLPWSPGKFDQGEGRFQRNNQDRPVLCLYLVATGSLDEHQVSSLLPKFEAVGAATGDTALAEVGAQLAKIKTNETEEDFAKRVLATVSDDYELEDDD